MEADQYVEPDESSQAGASVGTWRIENHDGAWQGGAIEAELPDGTRLSGLTVLVGEGAYEGLTAFVDLRGLIVADVPAIELYRPEQGRALGRRPGSSWPRPPGADLPRASVMAAL